MPETKQVKKTVKKTPVRSGPIIKLYDKNGAEKDSVELSKEIFSQKPNSPLLAQYVRVYLANQRQGTASAKTRGEVIGSTRKIYRQKGTGRARHGSIKAPIFVGGGVVGGPKPRDHSLKLSKKQKQKALFLALTLKQKENSIIAAGKDLMAMEPKTKLVAKFISQVGQKARRILFVVPKMEKNNLTLAVQNIPGVTIVDARSLNPFILLRAGKVIFVDNALSVFESHFLKNEN